MKKIIKIKDIKKIAQQLKKENKKIVIVGGFFDILHIGHIKFLRKAKEKGDTLLVLLESDETSRKLKGENRPINAQDIRAKVLEALEFVNYIISLPVMKNDKDYDNLISLINPSFIAVTQNDKNIGHKKRQAKITGAKLISVISEIKDKSTTKIAKIIEQENNL